MVQSPKSGDTVLVTGASSGIGRATARRFAAEGFRVFGTSRQPRPDEAGVEMLELDVRSDDSVARCVAQVMARSGRLDVLVNNAGVTRMAVVEETSVDEGRAVLETNFFGPARMVQAVLPFMREARRGRIINVGSLAAWVGEPGDAYYSASKHALAGYTEALRHEMWPFGVHVSLVELGEFKTDFLQNAAATTRPIADYDEVRGAVDRTFRRAIQGGADPEKAARLIVRIARVRSPRLRYVAGRGSLLPYLKVLLPQRLVDTLVRKGFGLERARSTSRPT